MSLISYCFALPVSPGSPPCGEFVEDKIRNGLPVVRQNSCIEFRWILLEKSRKIGCEVVTPAVIEFIEKVTGPVRFPRGIVNFVGIVKISAKCFYVIIFKDGVEMSEKVTDRLTRKVIDDITFTTGSCSDRKSVV